MAQPGGLTLGFAPLLVVLPGADTGICVRGPSRGLGDYRTGCILLSVAADAAVYSVCCESLSAAAA